MRRVPIALAALVLGACARPEPSGEHIAIAADFEGFRDWPSIELPRESLTAMHASGARRLYVMGAPFVPGEPLPVGTMLVKAVEEGAPETWEIHAMVKRGGDYNAAGARGWEFFDLALDPSGEVLVRWRGEGPPPGFGYPDEGEGDGLCNSCHGLFPERDYVLDRALLDAL